MPDLLRDQLQTALAGRYAVERELGRGGMATVYLARDVKHQRFVALKVLDPELGAVLGGERFLSEIRVTANLQHPNLLPLFDSGEAEGLLFYVMPFVEGESLRARLERERQLPVDEAVRIAAAVAAALDYAHGHGVIHRDLKPENILLQHGQPVVADFGIALAVSNAGGQRVTQTGLSLGTPQYMSPEQATGDRVIDGRTDVYSLGAVCYEMLTGDPPHSGTTAQAIIARLLTEPPRPIRSVRPSVPAHVEAAVGRALEKLPADRFATAKEFAAALSGGHSGASRNPGPSREPLGPGFRRGDGIVRRALPWLVAAASLATAAVALSRRPPEPDEVRFTVPTPASTNPAFGALLFLALSPDGRSLAYVAEANGVTRLFVRPLAATEARPLAGTENPSQPFWSSDSRSLAYVAMGKLYRVDVDGGTPRVVCALPPWPGAPPGTGSWSGDTILIARGRVYKVAAGGGAPVPVTAIDTARREVRHRFAHFLPDGRHFLYAVLGGDRPAVMIGSLDGGAPVPLLAGSLRVLYAAPGYLVYARDGAVFAHRFDARRRKLAGEPVKIVDGVLGDASTGMAAFTISQTGTLAFRAGGARNNRALAWLARDGRRLGTVGDVGPYTQLRLAPDGRRAAVVRNTSELGYTASVWTIDVGSGIANRLTADTSAAADPAWTQGGRSVAFFSRRSGTNEFYVRTVGGTADSLLYQSAEGPKFLDDVSADGRALLYHFATGEFAALDLTGESKPLPLGDANVRGDQGRFSPDARWVVYSAVESGEWNVYVAAFPAFDQRHRISARGGVQPVWRADGKEILYLEAGGRVMSVAVRGAGPTAEFAPPVPLFQGPIAQPAVSVPQYDVSRDGERLLFLAPTEGGAPSDDAITVVLNWRRMLQR